MTLPRRLTARTASSAFRMRIDAESTAPYDQWVQQQFSNFELENATRTKRLQRIASHMLSSPEQSLPQQNVHWPDLQAAYCWWQNERVTFDAVFSRYTGNRRGRPRPPVFVYQRHHGHRSFVTSRDNGPGHVGRWSRPRHAVAAWFTKPIENSASGPAARSFITARSLQKTKPACAETGSKKRCMGATRGPVGAPLASSQWLHVFDRGGRQLRGDVQHSAGELAHLRMTQRW